MLFRSTLANHAQIIAPSVASAIELRDLALLLPDQRQIVRLAELNLNPGPAVLLTGPSGSGKSTLFRAIAGIWPHLTGAIFMPERARIMLAPQRPYIPMGTLAEAIIYPGELERYSRSEIEEALRAAQLSPFIARLDEENHWGQRLSGGEQQRVAIARALLAKPNWLFLDEATSALDENLEAEIYKMLRERLDRKSTRLNSSHTDISRMPSSA